MSLDGSDDNKGIVKKFLNWWPNVRLGLETIALILLARELTPDPLLHSLKVTGIGVSLIVMFIIVGILYSNSELNKTIQSLTRTNQRIMEERQLLFENKQGEISSLEQANINIKSALKTADNYKKIYSLNNKAFAQLRDGHRENLINNDKEQFRNVFREYCNNINETFTVAKNSSSTEWHVCIKLLTQPKNNNFKANQNVEKVKVKTFMRDGRGSGDRAKIDRARVDHFVKENTDFLEIFEQSDRLESRCFVSNDLLTIEDYKNSSLKAKNKDNSPNFKFSNSPMEIKEEKWSLSYRSVIVSPICPGIMPPNLEDGTLIGFLCIDHRSKDVFNETDVGIASGFAEALYDILNDYINKYVLNDVKKLPMKQNSF